MKKKTLIYIIAAVLAVAVLAGLIAWKLSTDKPKESTPVVIEKEDEEEEVLPVIKSDNKEEAENAAEAGESAMQKGEYEEAVKKFEEARQLFLDDNDFGSASAIEVSLRNAQREADLSATTE